MLSTRRLLALFCVLSLCSVFLAAGFAPQSDDGYEEAQDVVVVGEEVDDADTMPVPCEGTNHGKGHCPDLTCGSLKCAGNWYSFAYDWCRDRCAQSNNCCGWAVDTSDDCACVVDANAEPTSYSCAPCNKSKCHPWPSACQ